MTLNEYQAQARTTAMYPKEYAIIYPALGLAGETGEAVEKVKKAVRKGGAQGYSMELDRSGLVKEMGDVLWYLANLASDIGVTLEAVALINGEKLAKRAAQDKIVGEGDNR